MDELSLSAPRRVRLRSRSVTVHFDGAWDSRGLPRSAKEGGEVGGQGLCGDAHVEPGRFTPLPIWLQE